jgi:2-polyprenyl-3-methyl-5-hydroxy-6-metoxy-1,4-benzoquinol methylase
MSNLDYELIWSEMWGDMQRYGPTHRHRRRIFGELLKSIPAAGIHTLADIGCGEGSNLAFFAQKYPQAQPFGFDVSQTALDRARRVLPRATFELLDVVQRRAAQTFDLVTCAEVVEHLPDDVTALRNIYAMTRHYALFSTVQGRFREWEKSIGHVRSYAPGELQRKLASVGFRIVKLVQWGFPFYSPLYRDLFTVGSVEGISHGRYGFGKKLACQVLYAVFALNRHDHGDVIFALVEK